ncbi:MAG: hypothetical protein WBQ39_04360, partial [Terriglobales bacterium]
MPLCRRASAISTELDDVAAEEEGAVIVDPDAKDPDRKDPDWEDPDRNPVEEPEDISSVTTFPDSVSRFSR